MQRVLVIGCSGAGKSTLARRLAEITGLPLIAALDAVPPHIRVHRFTSDAEAARFLAEARIASGPASTRPA